jgi:hypothetical protein
MAQHSRRTATIDISPLVEALGIVRSIFVKSPAGARHGQHTPNNNAREKRIIESPPARPNDTVHRPRRLLRP